MLNRNYNLDVVRIFAVISIMAVHVYYPLYSRPNYFGGISWWYAHVVNIVAHMGVPLFLMLSGSLLLSKPESNLLIPTLKRTFYRLGLPLLIWVIINMFWQLKWFGRPITVYNLFQAVFSADLFHYYFLAILISLYLLLPVICRVWQDHFFRRFLLISSTVVTLGSGVSYYLNSTQSLHTTFTIGFPYLSYFLWGDVIRRYHPSRAEFAKLLFVFLGMLFFTLVAATRNFQLFAQHDLFLWRTGGNQYFTDYLGLNMMILSAIAYVFLLRLPLNRYINQNSWLSQILVELSAGAYGMYLIHPMVIDYLDIKHLMIIHIVTSQLWLYITRKMLLVLGISFAITALARRLPFIRLAFGEKRLSRLVQ